VGLGPDPPDRWLAHGDRRWATELTELTVADVRRTISQPRMFARHLTTRINDNLERYAHLRDRIIMLSCDEDVTVPRDASALLDSLAHTLTSDIGYVDEGIDFSNGFPESLPMERGHHGQHGPFLVTVQAINAGGAVAVSASVQTRIKRSDAVAALTARVAAKDHSTNELLLVTCGMPDTQGYTCSVDSSIFQLLYEGQRDHVEVLPCFPRLRHLNSVVLHLWNTPHSIVWGKNPDLPWAVPEPSG
jgi:hypothetical protein